MDKVARLSISCRKACRFEPGLLYVPTFSSLQEAKYALQTARINLKNAGVKYGKHSEKAEHYLKECVDIQYVIDTIWPGK